MSQFVILIGPSACGKTTLAKMLSNRCPNIKIIVTNTTRLPRNGEKDGIDFNFRTYDQFQTMLKEGYFIATSKLYGNWYGVSKSSIDDVLNRNHGGVDDIFLCILDERGYVQVKEYFIKKNISSNISSIFIMPGDTDAVIDRILARGVDNACKERIDEVVRLKNNNDCNLIMRSTPDGKRKEKKIYDHVIVNDDLDECYEKLSLLIHSPNILGAPQI